MLIANCEKTQRTTGRRGRHGQQENSLLRVMAPSHRPSGNPGLFGRKFGNDDQCPGAENSHAGRSDPNAVTEGSRMDCRIDFQFRMTVAKGSLKAYTRQPAFSDSATTQAGTNSRGYNKNKLGAASWWTHHQDQYLDRDVSGFDATHRDTP